MRRNLAGLAIALTLLSSRPSAQDAAATIAAATKAIGAEGLTSITYTGTATTGNSGQSKTIAGPLAMTTISAYTRAIDLSQPYSRAKGPSMPPAVPGAPPPQPGTYNLGVAPNASGAGLAEIWITPWGFLKGASTGKVTAKTERAGGRPFTVLSEKLADGVYRITGNYGALAVEFKDHVVILEGGQGEVRGTAVIGETKRLFPSKPIRYVVNTHAHFDHSGGLATFAAEGITIITHDNNRAFLDRALGAPRTLVGDALAKSGRKPKVEGAGDRRLLRDDTRTIELHHVKNLEHSDGMLIAFLPKERVLFTGDFSMPAAGQAASPALVTLVQNVERLKLDFDRHILVHPPTPDRPLTKADLLAAVKGGS